MRYHVTTMRRPVSFKRTRKRWAKTGQAEIVFGTPRTWGGKRRGAGRGPKGARAGMKHETREAFDGTKYPAEVTVRVATEVGSLRRDVLKKVPKDLKALADSNECEKAVGLLDELLKAFTGAETLVKKAKDDKNDAAGKLKTWIAETQDGRKMIDLQNVAPVQ